MNGIKRYLWWRYRVVEHFEVVEKIILKVMKFESFACKFKKIAITMARFSREL
jgi:hypothetical protein